MIRRVEKQDKDIFIKLTKEFYQTDAVLSSIPEENISKTFEMIISNSPYVDGYFYFYKEKVAAYCLLSFTYSNEAGGLVLLIEELYVAPEFQRKGIGTKLLSFLEKKYYDQVAIMRLEVMRNNIQAQNLYLEKGFKELKYIQMIKSVQ